MKFFLPRLFVLVASIAVLSLTACSKASVEPRDQNLTPAHPVRGPESALIAIEQFTDFYCPYCKQQAKILEKVSQAYPDKIRWTFRHLPISGQPEVGSFPIHEASMCAAEQGRFWEFHDAVFALEKNADLTELAQTAHLDQPQFDECFKANRYRQYVLNDLVESQKRGVSGTPTFFINGELISGLRPVEYFAEKIDPTFAEKMVAERKKDEAEFLKKIDMSEVGRPSDGPASAGVTIIEFSDFHCPFCVKLTETIKQIMTLYPQDVRRVWRHYPLPIHPRSGYAHLASECAHSQGRFWDFHAEIFSNPASAHSQSDFEKMAEKLKLDANPFKVCFEDAQTKKKIENDVLLGMYKKVGSTPTFFVNDEMFVGAKPFEALKEIIDRKISESKK